MSKEILIFGHKNPDTDSICSSMVKQILNTKDGKDNTEAVRLGKISKETQFILDYLGLEAPRLIEEVAEKQKVILVDHNEFIQSAKGIEKATIIGVVDHHKISNFETNEPLFFTSRPYGCTSTILYLDFVEKGIQIEKTEAILMLSAIISDTLLFKSPTTTKKDIAAAEHLEKIAGIDMKEYGLEMLKAGTSLDDLAATELLELDAKELDKNGTKMVIAQVNTVDIESVFNRQNELEEAINNYILKNSTDIYILAITDILNTNSELLVLGQRSDLAEEAYGKNLVDNRMFLEGVVSRKKQLVPQISEII